MVICDEKGLTGYGADGQTTRFDVEDPVKVPCGINLPPSGWFLRELTHFVQCAEQNAPSDRVKKQQVLDLLSVAAVIPIVTPIIILLLFISFILQKFRLVIYKRGCYSLRFSFKMKVIG